MKVYQETTEDYIIKLNNRKEATVLHSLLEYINNPYFHEVIGDNVSEEEYALAKAIANELNSYLEFSCYY